MSRSVIVIGFDSLDPDLLRKWADAGELPTFASLFKSTPWARVANPVGFESGGAWMALMTGVSPDQHGVYDAFYRFNPRTYKIDTIAPPAVGWPSIWSRASHAGRRVAVIDVPYDFVDPDINGIHVCDWLVHVSSGWGGPGSNSDAALRQIRADYGLNPITCENRCAINEQNVHSVEGLSRVVQVEEQRIDWKARYSRRLLRESSWDFFFTVFHEAHDVGHMCWHAHDPEHDWHNHEVSAAVGDPLLSIYKKLDRATADLLDEAPANATVLVYCSHGIGPERTATRLLDHLLALFEWRGDSEPSYGWLDRASQIYGSVVPPTMRKRLARSSTINRLYAKREEDRLHRRRSIAVSPSYATGGVHLNLQGRERHGVIAEDQAERELDFLIDEFTQFKNAETNEPLINAAIRTSSLYNGPLRGFLPDLLLEWNTSHPIRRIRVPQLGKVFDNAPTVRSGDHFESKEGLIFCIGTGPLTREQDPIRVTDLSMTLATLAEAETSDLPGNVIRWLGHSLSK
jgi:predicted AlkP superfamily phosphohydrolase/phosphomutase